MSDQLTQPVNSPRVVANEHCPNLHSDDSHSLSGVSEWKEGLGVILQSKRGMERAPSSSASLKRKALIDWDTVQPDRVAPVDSFPKLQPLPPLPEIDAYFSRPFNTPTISYDYIVNNHDSFDPSSASLEQFILHLMHKFPSLVRKFSTIGQTLAERGVEMDMLAEWDVRVFGVFGVDELCAAITRDELKRDACEDVKWETIMQKVFMDCGGSETNRLKSEHEVVFGPIFVELDSLLLSLSDEFGSSFVGEFIDILREQRDNCTDSSSTTTSQFQALCYWISDSGRFTFDRLDRFRALGVVELSLTSSFQHKSTFDIAHMMSIFSLGNSFLTLTTLDLSHIPLIDVGILQHLANLPLETLRLKTTQLESLSIADLLPLSWSLTHLDLSNNVGIDDSAIPCLNLLSHLVHLDVSGTSIGARLRDFILFARILQPSLVRVVPPTSFVSGLVRSLISRTPNDPAMVTDVEQIASMNQAGILAQLRLYGLGTRKQGENLAGMKQRLLLCAVHDRLDDASCLEMINLEK